MLCRKGYWLEVATNRPQRTAAVNLAKRFVTSKISSFAAVTALHMAASEMDVRRVSKLDFVVLFVNTYQRKANTEDAYSCLPFGASYTSKYVCYLNDRISFISTSGMEVSSAHRPLRPEEPPVTRIYDRGATAVARLADA
jgi:hypothetical protein